VERIIEMSHLKALEKQSPELKLPHSELCVKIKEFFRTLTYVSEEVKVKDGRGA
jgi:hypothetical protein